MTEPGRGWVSQKGKHMDKNINWLQHPFRFLDLEDFIVLSLIGKEGYSLKKVAQELGVTASNITHRTKKYKEIWPEFNLVYSKTLGRPLKPDAKTQIICDMATKVIEVFK